MKKTNNKNALASIFFWCLISGIIFNSPESKSWMSTTFKWSKGLHFLAGGLGGVGNIDGLKKAARFNNPYGMALDSLGNIYIADELNHVIRKLTPQGVVSTFAGSSKISGSVDGTGSAARFSFPRGIAVDASNNLYVTDSNNQTIRKITSTGVVTTIAGTVGTYGSVDGAASSAVFNYPTGIVVDSVGNIFVADTNNYTIRKITPGGVVSTFAGAAGIVGSTDATGTSARFKYPGIMAIDSSDNLYIPDAQNHIIRKVTSGAVVTTIAGTAGSTGSTDATGSAARFNFPLGVAVDSSGNIYVADSVNFTIRQITSTGVVTTIAGTVGSSGFADGTGSAAKFNSPRGIVVDSSGNLYISDYSSALIRKVTSAGVVTTTAGSYSVTGSTNGISNNARFNTPSGMAVDSSGNIFVADTQNYTIRKITSGGVVSTFAGTAGSSGSTDGTGSAARFNLPTGITIDSSNNLYVTDRSNNTIRKITSGGVVSTFAGTAGSSGNTDATGSAARFNSPLGITIDSANNLYVVDSSNHTIRKITSGGVVTTFAGTAGSSGSTDGTGSAARFYYPVGIAIDSSSNLFIAEANNHTIRKITTGGVVTTFAGTAGSSGSTDGTGSAARFNFPTGITIDSSNNLYIGDSSNFSIRKITSAGVVKTVIGSVTRYGVQLKALPASIGSLGNLGIVFKKNKLYLSTENSILWASPP